MKIIGHRGAKGLAPENTLASIGHALAHHVDEVEFDVRVTKDSVPILSHDASLNIGGKTLVIADHDYASLERHKPDIAMLRQALDLIDTKCRAYIEVKPNEPVGPIMAVITEYLKSGMYSSADLSLASKHQKTLLALHRVLPDIEKIVIESWFSTRAVLRAKAVGTKRISMNARVLWLGFLKPMKKRGWQITAYTVNDPRKITKWRPYLHAVVTDYPDLFEK